MDGGSASGRCIGQSTRGIVTLAKSGRKTCSNVALHASLRVRGPTFLSMPKSFRAVDKMLVSSYSLVSVGFCEAGGALSTVPFGIQGEASNVGMRTPRRSKVKFLYGYDFVGGSSGEGTPTLGGMTWS